jgi:riboflavin kinase/FMN adenylyltransferase
VKVIAIKHPHPFTQADFPELVMALGFFDGIHKGHQAVITTAKDIAERTNRKSAMMTFNPHPSAVLGKKTEHIRYITPLDDKIAIVESFGIDYLFIVHFSEEFASVSPEQFVDQYLARLNVRHVVAGFDYSYGQFGKGSMDTLPLFANGRFTQTIVEKQTLDDEKVSSSRIRQILEVGDFSEFNHLVGRYYVTKGHVIHGEKRGRKLGFPTANIEVSDAYIFPATGVYAVRIQIEGKWYQGVCNVGYKPTFHDQQPEFPSVEVHALDFSGNIYGAEVIVEWHTRLRSEQKFSGLEELIHQIQTDKENAQKYFRSQIN